MRDRSHGRRRAIEPGLARPMFALSRGAFMLSIRNLTHVYPRGVRALNAVSLEIPPGESDVNGPCRRRVS